MQSLVARDHRASDDIAVAVEVLGRRMHDEIRSERDGLLPGRRQEGVVDDYQRSGRAPESRERLDVGDAQQRVAGRLDPQQRGRLRQGGLHGRFVAEVHEVDDTLASPSPSLEQPVGAAVAIVRSDDAPAVRDQIADQGNRGHAGRRHDRTGAQLEIGERLRKQVAGRIPGARVVVAALLAEAAERERRGQMDRRHDGARRIVALESRANGLRYLVRTIAHATLPSAAVNMPRNCSDSLRNASCP